MPYKVVVIAQLGDEGANAFAERLAALGHEVELRFACAELAIVLDASTFDVAIVYADDECADRQVKSGTFESMLDILGIPYIGSSARSRAQAADRSTLAPAIGSLRLIDGGAFGSAQVPTGLVLTRETYEDLGLRACLPGVVERVFGGYPLIVRMLHQGVQWGSVQVSDFEDLREQLDMMCGVDDAVLVQEWVEGVHMSIAVLGSGQDGFALAPIAYGAQGIGPLPLSELSDDEGDAQAIRSELERAALEAHTAYGARDFSQVDLVWDGGRACVVDVDLAPLLTEDSPFVQSCAAAGISFDALLAELIEQAAARG